MLADEALAALRVANGEPASRVALARFFAENIAVQASRPGAHRHRRRRQRATRADAALTGMSEHVIVDDDGPVRTIRMNRPDKKNALTVAMYDAMAQALESAERRRDIRCVVIAGVPGAFSAGNDLADFSQAAHGAAKASARPVLRFLHALARSERPLVAAVQGVAVGVGTTMLLHCDHVVAGTDARFSTPFVSLGLVPEAGLEPAGAAPDGASRARSSFW